MDASTPGGQHQYRHILQASFLYKFYIEVCHRLSKHHSLEVGDRYVMQATDHSLTHLVSTPQNVALLHSNPSPLVDGRLWDEIRGFHRPVSHGEQHYQQSDAMGPV